MDENELAKVILRAEEQWTHQDDEHRVLFVARAILAAGYAKRSHVVRSARREKTPPTPSAINSCGRCQRCSQLGLSVTQIPTRNGKMAGVGLFSFICRRAKRHGTFPIANYTGSITLSAATDALGTDILRKKNTNA